MARVLDAGARILVAIPGPVPDVHGDGYVSPGHPRFDPVWRLLDEAGVPLALHAGLSGVQRYGSLWGTGGEGGGGFEGFKHAAFPLVAFQDRGISDTFAALICHGVLERFPNLRLASIENGAMWAPDLLRNLRDGHGKMPFAFTEHPVDQFRRAVWVAPYYEDDMAMLRDLLGVDRLLFGSDFPHAEGLPEPTDYREGHPHLQRRRGPHGHARQRPRADHPPAPLTQPGESASWWSAPGSVPESGCPPTNPEHRTTVTPARALAVPDPVDDVRGRSTMSRDLDGTIAERSRKARPRDRCPTSTASVVSRQQRRRLIAAGVLVPLGGGVLRHAAHPESWHQTAWPPCWPLGPARRRAT